MEHIDNDDYRSKQYTINDVINHYNNQKQFLSIPSIEHLLSHQKLSSYFLHIEKYANQENLIFVKKFEQLRSGLYILLRGHINFMSFQNSIRKWKHHRKQTDHTVKISTNAVSIQQELSVFESNEQNCVAFQDSFLLYIKEQQALSAKFYELYQTRMDLLNNYYVSKDHQRLIDRSLIERLMNVNVKIHSNFRFRSYKFRQNINLIHPAIVLKGRAKLKIQDHNSYEFEKHGVILPDLTYQVTSSQIQIMILMKNQAIFKKSNPMAFKRDYSRCNHPKKIHKSFQSSFDNSFTFVKDKTFLQKQSFSKDKDMQKMVKQSENYSIISSILYKKNLQFAKSQNLIKNTKAKKEKRYKSPLILFQIVNNKSRLAIPNFSDTPKYPAFSKTSTNSKYISSQNETNYESDQRAAILQKIRLSSKQYKRIVEKYNEREQISQEISQKKKIILPNTSNTVKMFKNNIQLFDSPKNFLRYAQKQQKQNKI